ncbi:choice-of-anchor D domain-containing protein [Candidatus Marinimicrobia bacterium]|nr:choice-of-anchor D domain-containing protein [Candidatus Neomarinimicrobiota bacterium]
MIRFTKFLFTAVIIFSACKKDSKTKYDITFSPSELDYGKMELGQSETETITIMNGDGSSGMYVGILEVMDTQGYTIEGENKISLDKGTSQEVKLTFKPTILKTYQGRFTVIDESRELDFFYEMPINGAGVGPVRFSTNETVLSFGLVKDDSPKTMDLVIQNSSTSGFPLNITISKTTGDFFIADNQTDYTIDIGSSLTLKVTYSPISLISNGSLEFTHNSSVNSSPTTINLKGIMDKSDDINSSILSGWTKFETGNYSGGMDDFQNVMTYVTMSSLYDSLHSKVLVGRGWSYAFMRNYNEGYDDLLKVYNDYAGHTTSQAMFDIYAGLAVIGNLSGFYSDVITYASALLTGDSDYVFSHKTTIDHKDIRMTRVQAYYNTGEFVKAAGDMDVLDSANAPHSTNAKTLLAAIQALSGTL